MSMHYVNPANYAVCSAQLEMLVALHIYVFRSVCKALTGQCVDLVCMCKCTRGGLVKVHYLCFLDDIFACADHVLRLV